MLIQEILALHASSSKVAIRQGQRELNYQTLADRVVRSATALAETTAFSGSSNIGIFLPNGIEYVLAYFSVAHSGRTIVPVSVLAKGPEIASTIRYCDLCLVITDRKHAELFVTLTANQDVEIDLFLIDDYRIIEGRTKRNGGHAWTSDTACDPEDGIAILLHTSGTTSHPKRVMLTHQNLMSNVRANIASLGLTADHTSLIALPMVFGYCNTAQLLTHLYLGARIVINEGTFMPRAFFRTVEREGVTNFTAVPTMLQMLVTSNLHQRYDLRSLHLVCFGGGVMPVALLRRLIQTFSGVGFVQTYGQTEASPRVTALAPELAWEKIGSVGRPLPGITVRVVDSHHEQAAPGQPGEILVRGPNVMRGYYKSPEATEQAIRDGWLYTGDLGYFDEQGYLYLVGRIKNIIISGGINIYPEEIEEVLLAHPAVKEVLVFGRNDEWLGEVPVAKLVPHAGSSQDAEAVKAWCLRHLAAYKVPRALEWVDGLPKTVSGKVRRYVDAHTG